MKIEEYWDLIPIGKENRVTYGELCLAWGVSKRTVRNILHRLSMQDDGSGLVLIRSSKGKGFYRTDNLEEIAAYRREVYNRARHTFAPFRKIDRILGHNESQLVIEL